MINFNNLKFEDYIEKQREIGIDQEFYMKMKRHNLAPLNFDADTKRQATMTARNLLKRFRKKGYQIFWRKSPSRRGFHFFVFFQGKQLYLPNKTVLNLRKRYGDCYARLRCDRQRAKAGMSISVLFNHKTHNGKFMVATALRELHYLKDLTSK